MSISTRRPSVTCALTWLCAWSTFIVTVYPGTTHASKIVMDVTIAVAEEETMYAATINTVNRGDEAARNLQATIEALGLEVQSSVRETLDGGHSWELRLPFEKSRGSSLVPGRYPVILRLSYSDSNGHPFSASAVEFFHVKKDTVSSVAARLSAPPMSRQGGMALEITNLEPVPIDLTIRWMLPREIVAETSHHTTALNGGQSASIKTSVRNISALPGSQYPVFAIMEYEKEGTHYSAHATTMLSITEPVRIVRSLRIPLIILLCILVFSILMLQLRRTIRSNGNP